MKQSPDQYIGLQKLQYRLTGASSTRFNLCRRFLKTSSNYPTLSCRFECPHLAKVPWCWLSLQIHHSAPVSWCSKIECHLVAALENMLLGLDCCFASTSWRQVKHNSDPTLDSQGCSKHSNLAEKILYAQKVPGHQIHRSRFHRCGTFFRRTFLSSLGHDTLLSVWKKMTTGNMEDSWCSTIYEDGPIRHVSDYVWSTCLRLTVGLLPLMIILIPF